MDLTHNAYSGLTLTENDCGRLTGALSDTNQMLSAIHRLGIRMIEVASSDDPEEVASGATAIIAMAKVGCLKVDAVARALGETGFGNFEDEFAPIVLGAGERSDEGQ